ncbi:DUF3575 domain-containing protein [Arundinibacter roseus]|uniref:DUF3575 domain-containing protein n=1 Tax=Arundinibacter roseus TaxID=2070510 RepID=A0A4R4KIT8_9BACT|nr:DUF3575 domain-containing protein [Arundinibacter roseus]TDB68167.1 DUF3575 domain-containing protein [Arundinibacter roseus]
MKNGWLIGFFIFLGMSVQAQRASTDSLSSVIMLKVTPLALFDLDNTVQVGIELPLPNPAWTFQQEMGYGHSAFNLWYSERLENPNRETWRFRSQLRYYFRKRNQQSPYLAAEFLFKKNSREKLESIGMDCTGEFFNRQCAYFQNRTTHLGRFVNAFHLKWGWQFYLSERWSMDMYAGAGLRGLKVKYLSPNVDDQPFRDNNFFDVRTDEPGAYGPFPSLSMGLHLSYSLSKNK